MIDIHLETVKVDEDKSAVSARIQISGAGEDIVKEGEQLIPSIVASVLQSDNEDKFDVATDLMAAAADKLKGLLEILVQAADEPEAPYGPM